MNRNGSIVVKDEKGRDRERYPIVYGARLKVRDGQKVEQGQVLVEWDPYTFSRFIIVDSPDEKKQPTIEAKDKSGKVARKYHMPSHAHLMVQDGESVEAGDVLAKIPRETTKTKDITGGLPRVVELFEARKPKDPAVISEIDGVVKDGGVVKGQRKMIIVPDDGSEAREYALPRGVHVNVHEGERVRAGEPAPGRQHQRQTHRGHLAADDAVGADRRCR
jgi:DNA-directed RNA polymerase subunit beta'